MPARLSAAVLHEGERSLALKVAGRSFELPLSEPGYSNCWRKAANWALSSSTSARS